MDIVDRLRHDGNLPDEEFIELLQSEEHDAKLFSTADEVRKSFYGKDVYLRGLIEFTNCCKNNCYYCGIRKDNSKAQRYRMDRSEILSSCNKGYELGFRTFVLQGGEDPFFTDEKICGIVSEIKRRYPDCAVFLMQVHHDICCGMKLLPVPFIKNCILMKWILRTEKDAFLI